jgi:hypothetical protein
MSSAQSDPASRRTEIVQDHTCLQAGVMIALQKMIPSQVLAAENNVVHQKL